MNILHQSAFGIDLNLDPLWCAWFSGWIDGEGSFMGKIHNENMCISARLQVNVRDDDSPLVYNVRDVLKCGFIHHVRASLPTAKSYSPNRRTTVQWICEDSGACRHILIPLFDKYPLHSKKGRDYKIWREIVMCTSEDWHLNGNRNHILDLCQQLKDIRKYVPPTL